MAPRLAWGPGALQQLLLHAAADGDLRLFKRIASRLDGGKGRLKEAVEAVKDRSVGALHKAARNGRTALCAYLVEELQVIHYKSGIGNDPFNIVINGYGNCEIVKILLVKGADVDSYSDCGTPLHVAAVKSHDGCMKILLDHRADAGADIKGVGTFTPLIAAATEGLTDFYKCLLEAGADPDVPDEFGRLPIEIASFQNRQKDVEILLPVTSHIPSVHDWSVDGIIAHVNKNVEDDPMYKISPADLKLEGSRAYKRKDYLTATKLYTMAARHDPGDGTLYSNKSICWLKMGEGLNALTDAHLWRMLRPDWPKACHREGAAHMFLKDYGKAYYAFVDGLKLDPGNIEIENGLREALKSLKMSRAA